MKLIYSRLIIFFLFFPFLYPRAYSQLYTIDIGIGSSKNQEVNYDKEYDYDFARSASIYHLTVGTKFLLSSKFTITPRLGYSWSLQSFSKSASINSSATIEDMTFITKSKTLRYLKSGLSFSYWITSRGNGFFIDGELQGLYNVTAKSKESKKIGNEAQENYTIDFKEDVKSFVPSFRLGFGYNLPLTQKFAIYALYGREFRITSFYTNINDHKAINVMIDVGFRYKLYE